MSFILIATSTGDELIPAKDTVVAASNLREPLEDMRIDRAKERAEWLARNPLPWWAQECVIHSERIEEGPVV